MLRPMNGRGCGLLLNPKQNRKEEVDMPFNSNKIDVTLTAEQVAAIIAALDTLDTALPFIVSLTPEERQRLFRMGTRSEGFVRDALVAAQQYPEHMPPSLEIAEMQKDIL